MTCHSYFSLTNPLLGKCTNVTGTGLVKNRSRSGWPKISTSRCMMVPSKIVKKNRMETLHKISNEFHESKSVKVSEKNSVATS